MSDDNEEQEGSENGASIEGSISFDSSTGIAPGETIQVTLDTAWFLDEATATLSEHQRIKEKTIKYLGEDLYRVETQLKQPLDTSFSAMDVEAVRWVEFLVPQQYFNNVVAPMLGDREYELRELNKEGRTARKTLRLIQLRIDTVRLLVSYLIRGDRRKNQSP